MCREKGLPLGPPPAARFRTKSTPLHIRESESPAPEMFLVHPDFFQEIIDDLLLVPGDPGCRNEDEKP